MVRGWMRAAATNVAAALLLAAPGVAVAAPADPASELLYFSVAVGPDGATRCTIVGQLFLPAGASPANPVPAVLTTHGFGGSYRDQVPAARMLAAHGYAALAYSGLGFGGAGCKIHLDDPDYDGRAAAQLVSFLGGQAGVAFTDPALRNPRPALAVVRRDATDHRGAPSAHDPRVGMVGGSYGGGAQFAAAAVDPRIDTLIPIATWNDLVYSLMPNGAAGAVSGSPGAVKALFTAGLFASGATNPGVDGYLADPARAAGCPNYEPYVCAVVAQGVVEGRLDPANHDRLRRSSVASYIDKITVPVLLAQGQQDTLFDLNEAAATYRALAARGVEVKMMWQSWGHSNMDPAPGEYDLDNPDPVTQYQAGRFLAWFDRHLKDLPVDTGPEFAYFRDWVPYGGNAAPAYGVSGTFPVGAPRAFALSGDGALAARAADAVPGAATVHTAPFGLPTGIAAPNVRPGLGVPDAQLPGTQAQWTSAPLSAPLDVVGAPTVTLRVDAAPGEAVVFAKLYDVAPDGAATLVNGLVTPVRLPGGAGEVAVTLSGVVHRFAAGHSVRLAVAGGDVSFRGSPVAGGDVSFRGSPVAAVVTVHADGSGPLVLPAVG